MRVAVRGMMPKNTVAKDSLKRLHIYAGAEHICHKSGHGRSSISIVSNWSHKLRAPCGARLFIPRLPVYVNQVSRCNYLIRAIKERSPESFLPRLEGEAAWT